jgi:peptidyl-dipeptidase Dcp
MIKMWSTLGIVVALLSLSCAGEPAQDQAQAMDPSREQADAVNPLLAEWETPFGVPVFDRIRDEHYLPAIKEGMSQEMVNIQAIVDNPEPPTFSNTVAALDRSDALLTKVLNVFRAMRSANTNETLQGIAKETAPMLAKHRDDILLNEKLFGRIKAVHEQQADLDLDVEQQMLLEEFYKDFVRGGANLGEEQKAALRKINEELALLTVQFGENILKENNGFELVIENEAELAGLSEASVSGAAEAAEARGHQGKWVFTLHKPSMIPFLQFAENRALREQIFSGYINRGNNGNELDNKENAARIAVLRVKRSKLLGYDTHADYVLEENMAKSPERVYEFLDKLWAPALAVAKQEVIELQAMIDAEGGDFKLQPWDWWYYAEKLRKEKYDLDEESLRPYFKLENVIDGVFTVANNLYGITLEERFNLPKYHEDVKTFEVKEADGSHLGILYVDYFPRESKRGGAWMNSFRKQRRLDGEKITPVIYNVGNFSKPTADKPALISLEEVDTLFHEFGHGLHGLLSDCTYEKLSGTAVPRDFVELPSQIMENWATHPEVLKLYARHYETGEPIPDELVAKIKASKKFNQGFATVEYLAASYLDMDWHTLGEAREPDTLSFEDASLGKIHLIPEIVTRYRSSYFNHIFAGGYASGYYSYVWAEVLDADAFQAFRENGLFDSATAAAFRQNILSRGGSEDPMVLYKRFRGAEPKIQPLLERRGLTAQ